MKKYIISPLMAAGLVITSSTVNASDTDTPRYTLTQEQKRLITALLTAPKSSPGIGVGVPTGFGAGSGQAFFSIGGTTTEDADGDTDYDGSASLGIGFGDPQEFAAIELQANIISLTDNAEDSSFGEEGSASVKVSRNIGANSGVALGAENLGTWGDSLDDTDPSVYLAFTNIRTLSTNPFNPLPLSLTIGLGNERFRDLDNNEQEDEIGLFGAAALAVHRQIGLIVDYNGNYFSAGASLVPLKKYPLTFTLSLVNLDEVDAADGGTSTGDSEFGASIGYSLKF